MLLISLLHLYNNGYLNIISYCVQYIYIMYMLWCMNMEINNYINICIWSQSQSHNFINIHKLNICIYLSNTYK